MGRKSRPRGLLSEGAGFTPTLNTQAPRSLKTDVIPGRGQTGSLMCIPRHFLSGTSVSEGRGLQYREVTQAPPGNKGRTLNYS